MNLSKIKTVGFISNFNPKQGYPEFGTHTVKSVEVKAVEAIAPVTKVIPKWKKRKLRAIKEAKKEFNARVGSNYKPKVLVSTALS